MKHLKINDNFNESLSIEQLEERFEMTVASSRSDSPCEDGEPCLTVGSW